MFFAVPTASAAINVFNPDACKGNTTVCPDKKGNGDIFVTIKNIINVLLYLAGAIAVIVIVVGGLTYATSGGDQGKVKQAKDTILYAVIGLIVATIAYAIVNFVVGAF